jgi:hypothetical protein
MTEEINRILDELVDDFQYILNMFLDYLEEKDDEEYRRDVMDVYEKWFV